MQRSLSASLVAGAVIVVAACGGAIDNGDLFQKDQGTTSGTSGGTPSPSPSPSSSPTTAPPSPTPSPPKPATKCAVSFKADVLALFAKHDCSALECHGGPAAFNEPAIDTTNPQTAYKQITTFTLSTGKTYVAVGNTEPKASGMYCNFRGNCGTQMPLVDKLASQELDIIDAWLACGSPFN
jgi:hypothetical protein